MPLIRLPGGVYEYNSGAPLGRKGGFGQVYEDSAGQQPVAVKMLHIDAAEFAHRELRIANELKGKNFQHVVEFIDAGEDSETGRYFVVMPKAQESLQKYVERNQQIAADET